MTYYVVQVKSGWEEKVLQYARKLQIDREARILWPRRKLRLRRHGRWRETLASIFPGYLFLEIEGIGPELYWRMRRIPGFVRFLRHNHQIEPLCDQDREILVHFLSYGEIVSKSQVAFDEHKRIRVISGPLKSLEGRIVKVDRRKGRARVRLDFYEDSFFIDFGFEYLELAGEEAKSEGSALRQ